MKEEAQSNKKTENNSKEIHKQGEFISSESEIFEFSPENMLKAQEIIAKYPEGRERSAIMPLLYLVQEQNANWIPHSALFYIAKLLKILPIHVAEVASFYTMFNLKPVGKYLLQICRTPPCYLCGSEAILNACKEYLQIDIGQTTADQRFTLVEVECLGACISGPVAQINNDYYEKLTANSIVDILKNLA